MFGECSNLKKIKGLNNFNTSNVTKIGAIFDGCHNLEELDLSNFNTSKMTDMSFMFNKCYSLK